MDIDKLREELKEDEGCKYEIYLDHLGLPTFGIGHLVTEWDQEYEKEVGTEVSEDRVNNCFQVDIWGTINDCKVLYSNFDELPEEVQLILANMMFNLGRPRLTNFVRMREAVNKGDWQEAKIQMLDSKWANQVPNRANRLSERMGSV
jgi:GH24 family phage-related lysozyme (muramidase)